MNEVNEGTEDAARQRSEASSPDRLPVDEHRTSDLRSEEERNRLGRVWLSWAASGCADLTSRQGCADPANRQGCADPANRQGCADLNSRQGCAGPSIPRGALARPSPGGNERGRVAPGTRTTQARDRRERAQRGPGPERPGGFQAVLMMSVSCRCEPGAFEAVFAVIVLSSEQSENSSNHCPG